MNDINSNNKSGYVVGGATEDCTVVGDAMEGGTVVVDVDPLGQNLHKGMVLPVSLELAPRRREHPDESRRRGGEPRRQRPNRPCRLVDLGC